ncbi:MAG TPA: glycosyl hydrolase, partial [Lacunisphaera sp.]|nr:glycosyl hydrolase [Lacunisphaera sp.]
PWHDYLARCQFLLRQGRPVADLCFLQPENTPQRFRSPVKSGAGPTGHDFDGCPPEALLERMSVQDGRLVLPEGQSYRLLVLPRVRTMTPALLRKIRDLVVGGATVLGLPPVKSPSLQDYPRCDEEVWALARELWGEGAPPAQLTFRAVGRGRVIWGRELEWPEPPYAAPTDLEIASWIWSGEGNAATAAPPGRRHFRRRFNIDRHHDLVSAQLVVVADDHFECWVNRNRSDAGHNRTLDVATRLVPGENLIAVTALNRPGEPGQPNPAGLAAALTLKYRDGSSQVIRTDSAWEVTEDLPDGWPPGTGGDWSAVRVLGPVGMAPWGVIDQELEQEDPIPDLSLATRALELIGVPPDFRATAPLLWIHRQADGMDVYFLSNQEARDVEVVGTFRTHASAPELWWPDSGKREAVTDFASTPEGTRFPLRLDAGGSVFVVFRSGHNSAPPSRQSASVAGTETQRTLAGPWTLAFPEGHGAPVAVQLDRLISLSEHPEAGVRYFSGTAVYRTTFIRPPHASGARVLLDLGRVEVMAQVRLNGQDLGVLWKPPYRVEATGALRDGENQLEIRVTNLWINRLIGDEHLPEDSPRREDGSLAAWPPWLLADEPSPTGRFTFASLRQWRKDDPLPASGLHGPVTLRALP